MPLGVPAPKNLEASIEKLATELGEIVRAARAGMEKAAP